MSLPVGISIIFYIALMIYFYIGSYILVHDIKSAINGLFFVLCLALCIWSFTFSIANSADNYETCLLWRRISVLGWGVFASLLLHFNLLVAGKYSIFKNIWIYILLYVPSLIIIIVFGVVEETAEAQYNLIRTAAGWINIPEITFWEIFYRLYYVLYTLASLFIIHQWGRMSEDKSIRKQSRWIIISVLFSFICGSLSDIIINTLSPNPVPEIAPVIMLLSTFALLLCIKKYGLFSIPRKNHDVEPGMLMSRATVNKLYSYLSLAYAFAAFVSFAAQYFGNRESLVPAALFSLILLALGLLLYITMLVKISEKLKHVLANIILTITIPLILFKYIDYSYFNAWAVPVIFILISIALNQRKTIFVLSITTVFSYFFLWHISPVVRIPVLTNMDHIIRIIIILIVIIIAYGIHRIYTQRLKKYESQVLAQKLSAEISANLVSANKENINEKILNSLTKCGIYFNADIAYIFSTDQENCTLYEWSKNNGPLYSEFILEEKTHIRYFSLLERIHDQDILDVTNVLYDQDVWKQWLDDMRLRSFIAVPLRGATGVTGILSFGTTQNDKLINDDDKQLIQMVSHHLTDVLYKIKVEKELNYLAYFDTLTGLPNRTLFKTLLDKSIKSNEKGKLIGVIHLDIDYFKSINDILGHNSGDKVLVQVGRNIKSCLGEKEIVSRFGGDEFLLLIPDCSEISDIEKFVDKIIDALKKPFFINKKELVVTGSIGVAVFPIDGKDAEDIIKSADLAKYRSKETGRNRITFFTDSIMKQFCSENELISDLYHALGRNELILYYQPKVCPYTNMVTGFEALVRWQHPKKGLIPPFEFIPIAERIGLIASIDYWVFENACKQNKVWQEQGLPMMRVSINISIAELFTDEIVSSLQRILSEITLEPQYVELEITESLAYYNIDVIKNNLNRLRSLGISLAIDDFGSDYSSLSRLQEITFDRIKIDRQFVLGLSNGTKGEKILNAIFSMSKALNLHTTVEGVETEQQLSIIKNMNCDEVQGYYYYKPMKANELEVILRQQADITYRQL